MEFEFLTFLGLLLFGAPLVVFIILITKMSSMNNALENISFDISTLQTMIEKMQQEGIKQTAQTTETKPKDDLERLKSRVLKLRRKSQTPLAVVILTGGKSL